MPYGFEPIKVERFGGLNTLVDPTNLPNFASPDCQDVEFLPGLVRTRPGLTSLFAALGGNPTVNYLKSYITPTALLRALVLDSFGNLYKENPIGTLALISSAIAPASYGNSVSLFGREYIAIGDGKFGIDMPLQFDDTNLDRVSQVGPGAAPTAADENISFTILAAPNGLKNESLFGTAVTLSESGNLVTVVGSLPVYARVGDTFSITASPVAGYNGTWTISSILNLSTWTFINNTSSGLAADNSGTARGHLGYVSVFTTADCQVQVNESVVVAGATLGGYNLSYTVRSHVTGLSSAVLYSASALNLADSGGGTVSPAGNIVIGVHQLSVVFVTRQGYITAPAPQSSWTAAGGKRAIISNIPTGPPNIAQRILIFTAAGGQNFFYLGTPFGRKPDPSIPKGNPVFSGSMIVADNTTTQVTVDFSDTILLEGNNVDALFNLIELGECSGAVQYFSRLFWWGERNKIQNFINMSFDGGPLGISPATGWTLDATFGAGGNVQLGGANSTQCWRFSGVSANPKGRIFQSAYQDSLGNPILQSNTQYSIRVRVTQSSLAGVSKSFFARFNSATLGGDVASATFSFSGSIASQEFIVQFSALTPLTIPSDMNLVIDGALPDGVSPSFSVDSLEIFPTNRPFNTTIVRASKVEDPESYDGITGFLQPSPSDGQPVRCCFVLRNLLYMAKDRKLYVTQDDGINEPNQWTVQEVSAKVGTLSARGVGIGDEWAIIAGLDGVYYFDGSEPQKISQEIQPTWDSINWSLGHLIDVKVDTKRKRVHIAVPLGASATANNRVLTLDFTDGFGDPNPTNTVNIAGIGRKWSPWVIACNSMNFILRSDGTQRLWFGNQTANGKIYQLDTTGTIFTDDGAKINDYWQSGYFQTEGRLLFGGLSANVIGVGMLGLILRKGDQSWITNLRSWLLSANGFRNMERNLNIETERLALRFASTGVGDHFSLQGLALYARESVFAPLRGVNY